LRIYYILYLSYIYSFIIILYPKIFVTKTEEANVVALKGGVWLSKEKRNYWL